MSRNRPRTSALAIPRRDISEASASAIVPITTAPTTGVARRAPKYFDSSRSAAPKSAGSPSRPARMIISGVKHRMNTAVHMASSLAAA